MPEQCALTAAAPAHDDKDVAVVDGKIQIAHQNKTAVSHGEMAHGDMRSRVVAVRSYSCHVADPSGLLCAAHAILQSSKLATSCDQDLLTTKLTKDTKVSDISD